jgi:hypothetical protein
MRPEQDAFAPVMEFDHLAGVPLRICLDSNFLQLIEI